MIKSDPSTLFFTVFNLLVLLAILKHFLYKPVLDIIKKREDMINNQFESAKKAQDVADNMKSEYEEKLAYAKRTSEEMVVSAKERIAKEREDMLLQTRREQEAIVSKAKSDIAAEKEKAEREAQAEIAAIALTAARKIVKSGE
jgi:F-type H+-transporting ATPase subunit b